MLLLNHVSVTPKNEATSVRNSISANHKSVYFSANARHCLDLLPLAEKLDGLGFDIYASGETVHMLNQNMVAASTAIHTVAFDYVVDLTGSCTMHANVAQLHSLQSAQDLLI